MVHQNPHTLVDIRSPNEPDQDPSIIHWENRENVKNTLNSHNVRESDKTPEHTNQPRNKQIVKKS